MVFGICDREDEGEARHDRLDTASPGFTVPLPSHLLDAPFQDRDHCIQSLNSYTCHHGFRLSIRSWYANTWYLSCRNGAYLSNSQPHQHACSQAPVNSKCPYRLKIVQQPHNAQLITIHPINQTHNHAPFPCDFHQHPIAQYIHGATPNKFSFPLQKRQQNKQQQSTEVLSEILSVPPRLSSNRCWWTSNAFIVEASTTRRVDEQFSCTRQ